MRLSILHGIQRKPCRSFPLHSKVHTYHIYLGIRGQYGRQHSSQSLKHRVFHSRSWAVALFFECSRKEERWRSTARSTTVPSCPSSLCQLQQSPTVKYPYGCQLWYPLRWAIDRQWCRISSASWVIVIYSSDRTQYFLNSQQVIPIYVWPQAQTLARSQMSFLLPIWHPMEGHLFMKGGKIWVLCVLQSWLGDHLD